jgi:multiple sugar transport system ATP-binding protein
MAPIEFDRVWKRYADGFEAVKNMNLQIRDGSLRFLWDRRGVGSRPHDQTEAMTLGDRVAVMREGVVQQVDTPGRLHDDPVPTSTRPI